MWVREDSLTSNGWQQISGWIKLSRLRQEGRRITARLACIFMLIKDRVFTAINHRIRVYQALVIFSIRRRWWDNPRCAIFIFSPLWSAALMYDWSWLAAECQTSQLVQTEELAWWVVLSCEAERPDVITTVLAPVFSSPLLCLFICLGRLPRKCSWRCLYVLLGSGLLKHTNTHTQARVS